MDRLAVHTQIMSKALLIGALAVMGTVIGQELIRVMTVQSSRINATFQTCKSGNGNCYEVTR
jgi:hypothetical protein